jgi:hypothetical protein
VDGWPTVQLAIAGLKCPDGGPAKSASEFLELRNKLREKKVNRRMRSAFEKRHAKLQRHQSGKQFCI